MGKESEKLRQLGINTIGVDVDDTLIDTSELFRRKTNSANKILLERVLGRNAEHNELSLMADELTKEFTFPLITEVLRGHLWVRPIIMEVAVRATAMHLGLDAKQDADSIESAVSKAREIYTEVPGIFEGAKETVEVLTNGVEKVFALTHANEGWTALKVKAFFENNFDGVICFDTKRPKAEQMAEMVKEHDINPGAFLMIGDNFWQDMWSVVGEMGGRGILIRNKGHIYDIISKLEEGGEAEKARAVLEALKNGRLVVVGSVGEVSGGIGRLR